MSAARKLLKIELWSNPCQKLQSGSTDATLGSHGYGLSSQVIPDWRLIGQRNFQGIYDLMDGLRAHGIIQHVNPQDVRLIPQLRLRSCATKSAKDSGYELIKVWMLTMYLPGPVDIDRLSIVLWNSMWHTEPALGYKGNAYWLCNAATGKRALHWFDYQKDVPILRSKYPQIPIK